MQQRLHLRPRSRRRGVGHAILGVALLLCGIDCLLIVLLALTLHFLPGPIPNMAFAGLFIGSIGLACLCGAWHDLRSTGLRTADLTAAKGVYFEDLEQQAFSLEGATLPNGRKYEERSRDNGGSQ